MTKMRCNAKGEGIVFANLKEVVSAFQFEQVALHAKIRVRLEKDKIVDTTAGRVILYDALPQGADFNWVNKVMKKSDLVKLVEKIYYRFGNELTVICLDKIKKVRILLLNNGWYFILYFKSYCANK